MEASRFEEIMAFAISKEEEAAQLYEHAQSMTRHSNARVMFEELAKQEWGHKRMLENVRPEDVAEYSTEPVRDLRISDYLVEVAFRPDMDYQDILILSMKREEKAHALYASMEAKATDPSTKKLFAMLAREEAKHKLRLEREYDEHVLTEN
jgi:rubrerythrin